MLKNVDVHVEQVTTGKMIFRTFSTINLSKKKSKMGCTHDNARNMKRGNEEKTRKKWGNLENTETRKWCKKKSKMGCTHDNERNMKRGNEETRKRGKNDEETRKRRINAVIKHKHFLFILLFSNNDGQVLAHYKSRSAFQVSSTITERNSTGTAERI